MREPKNDFWCEYCSEQNLRQNGKLTNATSSFFAYLFGPGGLELERILQKRERTDTSPLQPVSAPVRHSKIWKLRQSFLDSIQSGSFLFS